MNRTEFLATVGAACIAVTSKALPEGITSAVVTKDDPKARPPKTKIAVESRALRVPGLTVREIMEIYAMTGVFIYTQPPDANFKSIAIIEGDAEIWDMDRA